FDPDDERVARAAWSRIAEPGDEAAGFVVAELGAAGALLALYERPDQLRAFGARAPRPERRRAGPPPGAGWRERLRDLAPRRDLATAARFGGRLVVPGDREWPTSLDGL